MDPKEKLRRFLEQRRETGESELVLDGMSVEEVLRILGAKGAGSARPADREVRSRPAAEPASPTRTTAAPAAPADLPGGDDQGLGDPGDWRAALRAAGTAGPAGPRRPAPAPRPAADAVRPNDDAAPASSPDGDDDASEAAIESAADASPRSRAEDASIARRNADEPGGAGMEPSPAPGVAAGGAAPAAAAPPSPATDLALPGIDAPTGLVVGATTSALFAGPAEPLATLDDVARAIASCTRCPLYATAIHPVPGEGDPNANLMCVGEAPGQNEDETGRPFVGAAGQLLTKILAAIKLSRDDVFIANVLKHRPPGNRNPGPDEVVACSPYLVRQVELVRPKVIIAFGAFAAQTLLGTKTPIGKLRGAVHRYYGIPLVVTYHPAALLRNEAWKRPTWEDVKLARRILDRAPGA